MQQERLCRLLSGSPKTGLKHILRFRSCSVCFSGRRVTIPAVSNQGYRAVIQGRLKKQLEQLTHKFSKRPEALKLLMYSDTFIECVQ